MLPNLSDSRRTLPGIGEVAGLAPLLPFTYNIDALAAFALLLGMGPTTTTADPLSWRAPPKNVELMPQHQDLGFQLLSRPEAVAQHADE